MIRSIQELMQYMHILEAVRDGKTTQVKIGSEWVNIDTRYSDFTEPPEHYRVKPDVEIREVNAALCGSVWLSVNKPPNVRFTFEGDDLAGVELIKGKGTV
jgi:hypothetical protein